MLAHALALAFERHRTATHYALVEGALVLLWRTPSAKTTMEFRLNRTTEESHLWGLVPKPGSNAPEGFVAQRYVTRRWSELVEVPITPLPYPLTAESAPEFVAQWLAHAPYPVKPNIDGSVKMGWRVFNGAWGHVHGQPFAFVAIAPTWAMYGK